VASAAWNGRALRTDAVWLGDHLFFRLIQALWAPWRFTRAHHRIVLWRPDGRVIALPWKLPARLVIKGGASQATAAFKAFDPRKWPATCRQCRCLMQVACAMEGIRRQACRRDEISAPNVIWFRGIQEVYNRLLRETDTKSFQTCASGSAISAMDVGNFPVALRH